MAAGCCRQNVGCPGVLLSPFAIYLQAASFLLIHVAWSEGCTMTSLLEAIHDLYPLLINQHLLISVVATILVASSMLVWLQPFSKQSGGIGTDDGTKSTCTASPNVQTQTVHDAVDMLN